MSGTSADSAQRVDPGPERGAGGPRPGREAASEGRSEPLAGVSPARRRWGAPLAAAGVTAGVYALTAQSAPFSDSIHLASMVSQGPQPYYNVAYVPLAWAFHRLGAWTGWSVDAALVAFSILCASIAVALLGRLLARAGGSPASCFLWCLFVAATPSLWFFGTVAEVHALQLVGVVASVSIALRARRSPPARAVPLLGLAGLVAVVLHSSSTLLAPALLLLAIRPRGARDGQGLSWGTVGRLVLAGAVVLAALLLLFPPRYTTPGAHPAGMLWVSIAVVRGWVTDRGLFPPSEVAAFLADEWLRTLALALPAVPLAFVGGRRNPYLPALLAATAAYAVVFSQSGVRENGAYYVSLLPFVALAGDWSLRELGRRRAARGGGGVAATRRRALVAGALAVLAQGAWARVHAADFADRDADPRAWARVVRRHCPPGSMVVTTALPRWHALAHCGVPFLARDLKRDFELLPRSRWRRQVIDRLTDFAEHRAAGGRVYLDAEFVHGEPDHQSIRSMLARIRAAGAALVPVPGGEDPALYELTVAGG